jgi:tetratricopeptide (TPR) repeat protein
LLHGITDARMAQSLWCWLPFFTLLGLNGAVILGRTRKSAFKLLGLAPAAAALLIALVIIVRFLPLDASIAANRGAVVQARADLRPGLSEDQRRVLRAEAAADFEKALLIAPGYWSVSYHLGLIDLDESRFSDAVILLENAHCAASGNFAIQKALGLAYMFNGQLSQAETLLKDIPRIVTEINYWGWYYSDKKKDARTALNAYLLSLQLQPGQPDVQDVVSRLEKKIIP